MVVVAYDRRFSYIPCLRDSRPRPLIAVRITYGGTSIDRLAVVDSGADLPVFPKTAASILGIDLSVLQPRQSEGTAGSVTTWYPICEVTAEGITRQCTVAIVDNTDSPYLLGRDPFFRLLQIGFRESLLEFYLSLSP
jgi:hypothetical protein